MSTIVALILWFAVTAYAVLGGADYGAGFWDLTAGGARRGARPRALIDHAMAPVWEANNVWLIFALVVLWTGFPQAFAFDHVDALSCRCRSPPPGIVLRGSGFVFHKATRALTGRRLFGAVFALSSIMTPFFLGASFGAIASAAGSRAARWLGPTSILVGVLAVACAAFLAAVFLVVDARRTLDEGLESLLQAAGDRQRRRHRADRHRRPVRPSRRRAAACSTASCARGSRSSSSRGSAASRRSSCSPGAPPAARASWRRARWWPCSPAGASPSTRTCCRAR